MRQHAKFREDRSNHLGRYCRFSIFQVGGGRHLGFWKIQIFNGSDVQQVRTASTCQILSKSLEMRLRYGDFSIFQNGGRPPSWIFKSWKLQLPVPFGGSMCVIAPNFAKMNRTVPEIWPIFDFSRWRPPPSWILEISNFSRLGRSRRSNCVRMPNFVEIAQNAAEIWRFFQFLKMTALRHLGFSKVDFGNFKF